MRVPGGPAEPGAVEQHQHQGKPASGGVAGLPMRAHPLLSKTQFHNSLGDKRFYLLLFKSFGILPEHQITAANTS